MRGHWAIPVLASILILGGLGLSQQAFSDHFPANWVEAHWGTTGPSGPLGTTGPLIPDDFIFDMASPFDLDLTAPTMTVDPSGIITIDLPNFVDDLPDKFIDIEIDFGTDLAVAPVVPATAFGIDTSTGGPVLCGEVFSAVDPFDTSVWFISVDCSPNPDFETITLTYDSDSVATITKIWVETTSLGGFFFFPVGGTSIPIDTTSLLLAGASVNVWMIPVILSAAGFGILIARKI